MTKEVLCWHPRFNPLTITGEGVFLISEMDQIFLSSKVFPLIENIDGEKSAEQIAMTSSCLETGANFLFNIPRLLEQNILSRQVTEKESYIQPCQEHYIQDCLYTDYTCRVLNLSVCSSEYLLKWVSLFDEVVNCTPELRHVVFVLVDDFLDSRIKSSVEAFDEVLVIKISGKKIWLSPIIQNKNNYLDRFLERLWINQPVRKYLKEKLPGENHNYPVLAHQNITRGHIEQIQSLIVSQSFTNGNCIILFDFFSGETEYHPIHLPTDYAFCFKTQIETPIQLNFCVSNYHKDGGFRNISPTETLDILSGLISPISGVVTHIQEIFSGKQDSIKIFQSSFFKKPNLFAEISSDSFVQTCLGKGVSAEQSKASALGEAIERFCAFYQGCEPTIYATKDQLPGKYYPYQALAPYSENQYKCFNLRSSSESLRKQAVQIYGGDKINWTPVWSLSLDEHVYIPTTLSFANTPFKEERYGKWNSNGCSAGNTLEEAILQGLLEIIERDAAAIWWYNKIERAAYDLNKIDNNYRVKFDNTIGVDHDYWVLDITADINIPVMVAIAKNRTTGGFCFGFGCHMRDDLAATRALTEICQILPIREMNKVEFDFDNISDEAYLYPNIFVTNNNYLDTSSGDMKQDILNVMEKLQYLDFEILVLDYTRSGIPMKIVKVFVPGLCHIWPQLANERLYMVPVKLGWLEAPKNETTINQMGLYI